MIEISLVVGIVILAADDIDTVLEVAELDETHVERQEDTRADEQNDERHTPDDAADEIHEVVKMLQRCAEKFEHSMPLFW